VDGWVVVCKSVEMGWCGDRVVSVVNFFLCFWEEAGRGGSV
jgi:hypothetical protein